ncbi:hypothetical protein M885DRAFT_183379 [Pelagophyceae sp. CCMP2097]|nr:hypothetical protein M885DRAFT_183379 [Pelagophyceae sp. CCMP2097]
MCASSGFIKPAAAPPPRLPAARVGESYGLYDAAAPAAAAADAADADAAAAEALWRERRRRRDDDDEGRPLAYTEFLARLMLPQSAPLVAHVRAFIVHALAEAQKCDAEVRAGAPGAAGRRRAALDALAPRCAQFFDAAEAHLDAHAAWRNLGRAGLASARAALEKYVLSKIGHWAFQATADAAADAALAERCRRLATFVTPAHLDVKPSLCNDVVLQLARGELRRIDACKAPADKVDCVVRCASMIFSVLNLARAETSAKNVGATEARAGADDFLPVFIYVVLHAGASSLHSNCEFIEAFHNPAALMSKAGYCFVNLRSAVEFLRHLEPAQLGVSEADFDAWYAAAAERPAADAPVEPAVAGAPPAAARAAAAGTPP